MNCMPNDLLLEIFDRLDDNSLIAASKVCSRLREVIQYSPSTINRFTLVITHNDAFGRIHNGNYQNIVIWNVLRAAPIPRLNIEMYLEENKSTVKNLTLMRLMFNGLISLFHDYEMENLTKLTIFCCENNTDKVTPIELPHLTHLKLINSTDFLTFINVHNVRKFKISNHDNYERSLPPSICDSLNSFLKSCVDLRDFTLSNFNNRSTPLTFQIDEFKFNLMSLTVEASIINNLQEFLVSQKNSLRNLAIHAKNPDDELAKVIFNELTLTELEIDVEIVLWNFQAFTRNSTIKKLILRYDEMDNVERDHIDIDRRYRIEVRHHQRAINEKNPFEKIVSICLAVEDLSIYDFDMTQDDFLTPVHTSMPNLKFLKLSSVPSVISPIIRFNSLIRLEIDNFCSEFDAQNLIFLVAFSQNLKIIKINTITADLLNENYFKTIINLAKNLEVFYIGSDFVFTTEMYKAVKNEIELGHPLRKLMYTKTSHVQQELYDATNIKMKYFKFSFCDEPQLFFAPMINNCKLGGMERDAKERAKILRENLKYQLNDF